MTNFIYALDGKLLAELDAFNTVQKEYIYFDGALLAMKEYSAGGERLYYAHRDHLGTPLVLTNESGQVEWSADYGPFGLGQPNEDVDGDGITVTMNIRFPGQYYDAETGYHYNYHRYYDPLTGTYITSDPIGLAGGLNTYAYVSGNPINRFDTLGLTEEQIIHALTLVNESQTDLDVPSRINVSPLFDFGQGITNPITNSITIGDYYLNENLDCNGMRSLTELIIHESIHRSGPTSDMIIRPIDHPDIYDEAAIRFNELETLLNGRISEECGCPVN